MFLSDQETEVDLLYYELIAKTVVRLIRQTPEAPVTIGVHGDWGAGKSSVLKMTEAAFASDARVLCLWFNGWTFEGFEDAKTVVIETIVTELRRARPASAKVAEAARKVLKRIDWLKVAKKAGGFAFTAFTGLPTLDQAKGLLGMITSAVSSASVEDLKAIADQAGEYIKPAQEADHLPDQIHAFGEEFRELLEAADIDQLVVIVDDLDRCLPETAVGTLEAIRLFLFVPRTAFVIGADETMIEYSVRAHFPELPPSSGTATYARNYLEKLVQVPFRIPALGLAETRTYITLLLAENALGSGDPRFKKLLAAAREELRRPWRSRGLERAAIENAVGMPVPVEVEQAIVIGGQISRMLTEGTRGNPRQIKRFLNSMMLRHAVAEERGFASDIRRPELAKLMLAERFSPDLYEQVARLVSAAHDGKPPALAEFEDSVRTAPETKKVGSGKKSAAAASADVLAAEAAEWMKSDWARAWAGIDPPLKDIDLRPYVFATRDKRSYLGASGVSDQLDEVVDRLTRPRMPVRNALGEIRKLTGSEPEQVFDALRTRILEGDNLLVDPKGLHGLVALVEIHPALQRRLLTFLRDLPVEKIGPWAAVNWNTCFADAPLYTEFVALLGQWSQQSGNAALAVSAKGVLSLRRG